MSRTSLSAATIPFYDYYVQDCDAIGQSVAGRKDKFKNCCLRVNSILFVSEPQAFGFTTQRRQDVDIKSRLAIRRNPVQLIPKTGTDANFLQVPTWRKEALLKNA